MSLVLIKNIHFDSLNSCTFANLYVMKRNVTRWQLNRTSKMTFLSSLFPRQMSHVLLITLRNLYVEYLSRSTVLAPSDSPCLLIICKCTFQFWSFSLQYLISLMEPTSLEHKTSLPTIFGVWLFLCLCVTNSLQLGE